MVRGFGYKMYTIIGKLLFHTQTQLATSGHLKTHTLFSLFESSSI